MAMRGAVKVNTWDIDENDLVTLNINIQLRDRENDVSADDDIDVNWTFGASIAEIKDAIKERFVWYCNVNQLPAVDPANVWVPVFEMLG